MGSADIKTTNFFTDAQATLGKLSDMLKGVTTKEGFTSVESDVTQSLKNLAPVALDYSQPIGEIYGQLEDLRGRFGIVQKEPQTLEGRLIVWPESMVELNERLEAVENGESLEDPQALAKEIHDFVEREIPLGDVLDNSAAITSLLERSVKVLDKPLVTEVETDEIDTAEEGLSTWGKVGVGLLALAIIASPFIALAAAPLFAGNQNSDSTALVPVGGDEQIDNEMCPVPGPGAMELYDPSIETTVPSNSSTANQTASVPTSGQLALPAGETERSAPEFDIETVLRPHSSPYVVPQLDSSEVTGGEMVPFGASFSEAPTAQHNETPAVLPFPALQASTAPTETPETLATPPAPVFITSSIQPEARAFYNASPAEQSPVQPNYFQQFFAKLPIVGRSLPTSTDAVEEVASPVLLTPSTSKAQPSPLSFGLTSGTGLNQTALNSTVGKKN